MTRYANMAMMTVSGTPGTGTITLGSAAVADGVTHLTFAAAGAVTGDSLSYRIADGSAWEVGRGTYTSAGTTLTRGMLKSSTGSTISLTSAALVSIVPLGEDFIDIRALIGLGAPSVSWIAGANPNNAVLIIANRALTITGISGVVRVANGATANVAVKNGAGTNVHSGTGFNANGTVGTVQNLTLTTTTLASGDYLYLSSTDTFTLSVGNVTVFVN
jgi:hypothetical protein